MTRRFGVRTRRGGDGVRITADPRVRKQPALLVGALALVVLALVAMARLLGLAPAPSAPAPAAAQADAEADRAAAVAATGAAAPAQAGATPRAGAKVRVAPRARREPRDGAAGPPAESDGPRAGGADPGAAAAAPSAGRDTSPTHVEPPFAVGPPGSGIEVFPKPGTDPLKLGLVAPEDFALPEGYVRHFQVTDDGRSLEPILMFHPDYDFFDEEGRPIELPADLVVPPALAPPGFPIRRLEPPPPAAEGDGAPAPAAEAGEAP